MIFVPPAVQATTSAIWLPLVTKLKGMVYTSGISKSISVKITGSKVMILL